MIKTALRTIAAVVAGFFAAFLLVAAVELFSGVVHPIPPDCDGSQAAMCRHIENYPQWVLVVVVPMWGFTAFAGTWIAQKIGSVVSATIVGLLLLAAVGFNVAMLPYPSWFKVANLVVIPVAILLGSQSGQHRATSATQSLEGAVPT